jgi:hypothetical protein
VDNAQQAPRAVENHQHENERSTSSQQRFLKRAAPIQTCSQPFALYFDDLVDLIFFDQ